MQGIKNHNTSFFGFGTSQDYRDFKALNPDYVQLDGRSIEDLISLTLEFSRHVKFFNLDDKEDGNWEHFFTSDISVILASIISIDVNEVENRFNQLIESFYGTQELEPRLEIYEKVTNIIYDLLFRFNGWYVNIKKLNLKDKNFERVIENELYNIILDKLMDSATEFASLAVTSASKDALYFDLELDFKKFHELWMFENIPSSKIFQGKSKEEKVTSSMLHLRLIFRSVFRALNYTVYNFRKYFDLSLERKSDHKPDVALFISFLHLFGFIQQDLNNISSRLLDFYFRKHLKLQSRNPIPDRAYLNLNIADNLDRIYLPQGTLFSAGIDENNEEIIFESVRDDEITHARIENFKSVYMSRVDDLDTSHYKVVSHVYAADVANSLDGKGAPFEKRFEDWPLFGEEQEYKPQNQVNMRMSQIGLALASPIFHLNEGNREIEVVFRFTEESTRIFKRLVYDVHTKVNNNKEPDEPLNSLEDTFYQRIFNQVDNTRNFNIFLTGRKGWIEVDANTVNIKAVGDGEWDFDPEFSIEDTMPVLNALRIKFTLPVSKPPVVPFDPEVFEGEYFDTFFPVMKIVLNDNKQPFSYSFLQALQIQNIDLNVKVDKVKRFEVFDEAGLNYGNKGFFPFGAAPSDGSQSIIGIPELFKKNLTDVKFSVNWDKMPTTVEDFKNHYANYKDEIHPSSFKIRVGALSNYEIITDFDESLEFPLFSTTEGDPEIKDHIEITESEFHLDDDALYNLNIEPDYDLGEEVFYDDDAKTGFFVWELIEPRFGFGSPIYQNEINNAIAKNIEDPSAAKKFPREPVIPFIKNMVISYEASSKVNVTYGDQFAPEELFHLHPFGIEKIYYDGSPEKDSMLPRYNEDGYLFIGLSDVQAPESLSLHFELSSRKTKVQNLNNIPEIHWRYLSYNTWRTLDESKVLLDTTEGFTQSGIVKLQLPMSITNQSDIMDDGLYWISASVAGNTELLCQGIEIHAQAVEVQWKLSDEIEQREELDPIPPGTINDLVYGRTEITDINQPFESFGGKPKEETREFFYRVSERLRHKGRAVTHWDFERIMLEKFPNIQQVRCISYLSNPLEESVATTIEEYLNIEEAREDITGVKHSEGIKIVAIPKLKKHFDNKTPKFSLSKLLQMERTMLTIVPPFTKLQVINPQYEYVRVIANVKFIENMNNGLSLSRLEDDINSFISPWLYNASYEIQIGGKLNENVLQNYIKGLSYVKFLTKFSLLHVIEENGIFKLQDTASEVDEVSIIKARPWGVLLPDDNHEIIMVEYEEEEAPKQRVNTDEIIRFQNKVNILGDKKYIKIKNPSIIAEEEDAEEQEKNYTVSIKI